ncbi:MAG: recombinase family protein [Clostridia bacterium]|nr:recombinase family protein [Clostridia bacterium]
MQSLCRKKQHHVVKIYTDKALSGKSTDKRVQFQQIMRDSEKGIFDAVICWKIDRFARNRYDSAMNKYKLKRSGVRFFYAKESIPDGPEGIILESVMEGYAEYYSENLSQNVQRGNYESALECKTLGRLLLGYRTSSDGKYEIDPQSAPAVRYIFDEYAKGTPSVEICKHLNELGYTTLKGNKFNKNSIVKIIKNEKYIGIYTYKDLIRIENGIPPIITKDIYDKCQAVLARHRQAPRAGIGEAVGKYLLTGKLFCGKCGNTMVSGTGTSKTRNKYGYYQCSGLKKHICDMKRVKKEWIEKLVIDKLVEIVHDDDFINLVADKAIAYQNEVLAQDDNTAVSELEKQKKAAVKSGDNIIKAIESGMFSDALQDRYKALEEEIASLNTLIVALKKDHPQLSKEQIVYYLKQFRNRKIENKTYEEYLIHTFLNPVFLYDDKIILMFNYSGNNNTLTLATVEKSANNADFICFGQARNTLH